MKLFKHLSHLTPKMRSKCSEEKKDSILRAVFFLPIFIILFLVYALLNIFVMMHLSGLFYAMEQFSSPPLPGTLVSLDYIGFILPLVVTAALIVRYSRLYPGKASKFVNLVVFVLLRLGFFRFLSSIEIHREAFRKL